MGEIAGREADQVVVKVVHAYLRGREPEGLAGLFREGLARVGVLDVPGFDTELSSFEAIVGNAQPGDVIALMCHAEREAVDRWIREQGGKVDDAKAIRRKVVAARGEHEFEVEIGAFWALEDAAARVAAARELAQAHPVDGRLLFELAGALDAAGDNTAALSSYAQALEAGLKEPHRHRAQLQIASSLRIEGKTREAQSLVEEVLEARPHHTAALVLRALVQADLGRERQAVADLIRATLEATADPDTQSYRQNLLAQAEQLAPATAPIG